MFNPLSTYRVQLQKDFSLGKLEEIIPYLKMLGVKTLYASPVFEAVKGSTHGYDQVNPHKINPEIGTEELLMRVSQKLKEAGISWLQDIVPNHMAFHWSNPWIWDVLKVGTLSPFAHFFDAQSPGLMVPFLGEKPETEIENGNLEMAWKNREFVFAYFEDIFPLNEDSQKEIRLLDMDPVKCAEIANKNKELLLKTAGLQHYRLCSWKETDEKINYRRFFLVNDLICLNMQDERVFDVFHHKIKELFQKEVFQGLRVDHIDGLYDPETYLVRLRKLAGEETYINVEKILQEEEALPLHLPVQGTTGYDFLAMVNNLFTNTGSARSFEKFYKKLHSAYVGVEKELYEKKFHILKNHMQGELENLYLLFTELELVEQQQFEKDEIKHFITEFLVRFPVYRFYGNKFPLEEGEANSIKELLDQIAQDRSDLKKVTDLMEEIFLQKPKELSDDFNDRVKRFYLRCLQFTGPLMAKGVEDTLMYTYNSFIGHNEVGDSPVFFGLSATEFHQKMLERQENLPLSLNASSTHDTKRGEDVRARLNVLTDLPKEWIATVNQWRKTNSKAKIALPEANDEYFIYQTLVGVWPMPGEEETDFPERLKLYLEKVLREAKTHSDWAAPNEEYEEKVKSFALQLLQKETPFTESFDQFFSKIVDFGIINSLAQLLLKLCCPGVPDIYQGCELWDLSMVDPDNRRPVDFKKRQLWLKEINESKNSHRLARSLWEERYSGKIKLWLTHSLLKERNRQEKLFTTGLYVPLQIKGKYKEHVFAFARRHRDLWYITACSLNFAQICKQEELLSFDWKNTEIILPEGAPSNWEHLLWSCRGKCKGSLPVKNIFTELPIALLSLEDERPPRSAGVLLPVFSLPSAFGIGDFGPEARKFADFLNRSKQKYWQLLPLSPTEFRTGYSPYSSTSSMAGNILLISPEMLAAEGLLSDDDLKKYHIEEDDKVHYFEAEKNKREMFDLAYQNFLKGNFADLKTAFDQFCEKEAFWLNDFTLYEVIRQEQEGEAWYSWPDNLKNRDEHTLLDFKQTKAEKIRKEAWLQFVFYRQWKELRAYCINLNITFFGDLPFYMSYDSADVWAHREIFSLDRDGKMTGIAGVPPDYFSETGQLWGMPTFKWDVLKKRNYDWWIQRLRKNLELVGLLRLDHFRAFAEYWEVPAGEETAQKGKWLKGPGKDFFDTAERELGKLPFVAEDLGDNMENVYELRDELNLAGMKVIQFAFGKNMAESVDIPHNYNTNCIAYTGTHDNNTALGWYHEETRKDDRKRLARYAGRPVNRFNVHRVLSRLVYASVAQTVILPMQDLLGLPEEKRMNTPSSGTENWLWRLKAGAITPKLEKLLKDWVGFYYRG